jgi:hypothetical protein
VVPCWFRTRQLLLHLAQVVLVLNG